MWHVFGGAPQYLGHLRPLLCQVGCFPFGCYKAFATSKGEAAMAFDGCKAFALLGPQKCVLTHLYKRSRSK